MWFLAYVWHVVCFHVALHMRRCFKPFTTMSTGMWSLTGMGVSVVSEALSRVASVATHITNKVTNVIRIVHKIKMTSQALSKLKLLSADVAGELLDV